MNDPVKIICDLLYGPGDHIDKRSSVTGLTPQYLTDVAGRLVKLDEALEFATNQIEATGLAETNENINRVLHIVRGHASGNQIIKANKKSVLREAIEGRGGVTGRVRVRVTLDPWDSVRYAVLDGFLDNSTIVTDEPSKREGWEGEDRRVIEGVTRIWNVVIIKQLDPYFFTVEELGPELPMNEASDGTE